MNKLIYAILLFDLLLIVVRCSGQKDIQITEQVVVLRKIKEVPRWGQDKYLLTWETLDHVTYYQYSESNIDTIGAVKRIFLR